MNSVQFADDLSKNEFFANRNVLQKFISITKMNFFVCKALIDSLYQLNLILFQLKNSIFPFHFKERKKCTPK